MKNLVDNFRTPFVATNLWMIYYFGKVKIPF